MGHVMIQGLLLLCVLSTTMADCYQGPLKYTWRNRELIRYCLTREVKPATVLYNKTLDTQDCYHCTCGRAGLSCCGFGIKSGSYADRVPTPAGCMLVVDGCNFHFRDVKTLAIC